MNDADVKDVLSKIKSDEDSGSNTETDGNETTDNTENDTEEPMDNFTKHNESLRRDKINELFQSIINNYDVERNAKSKPIQNIGYCKKPFTSPNFE